MDSETSMIFQIEKHEPFFLIAVHDNKYVFFISISLISYFLFFKYASALS